MTSIVLTIYICVFNGICNIDAVNFECIHHNSYMQIITNFNYIFLNNPSHFNKSTRFSRIISERSYFRIFQFIYIANKYNKN